MFDLPFDDIALIVGRSRQLASLAQAAAGAPEMRGAAVVAEAFRGYAQGAQPALIDGAAGARLGSGRRAALGVPFHHRGRQEIVAIDLIAEPSHINQVEATLLGG